MKMYTIPGLLLPLSMLIALSNAQFFYHQPARFQLPYHTQQPQQHYHHIGFPVVQQQQNLQQQHEVPAHPSVVANSLRESQLPPELLKSHRFYSNPHIAAALAKESWFTNKEMPVIDREAEKIPRDMVYKLFKNAGWIKRR